MEDIIKFYLRGKRRDERSKRAKYLRSIEMKFARVDQAKALI